VLCLIKILLNLIVVELEKEIEEINKRQKEEKSDIEKSINFFGNLVTE